MAWDDLGNYYLMYGRSKDYNIDDSTIPYHQSSLFMISTMVHWMDRKTGITNWCGMKYASTVTFAMEKKTDKWDAETRKFVGADYEFVSEPYTVELVKN